MKPLEIGDSINSKGHRHIGISLGASWTYGLYHDWDSKVWYLTHKCKIVKVFGDKPEERKKAFDQYYKLRRSAALVEFEKRLEAERQQLAKVRVKLEIARQQNNVFAISCFESVERSCLKAIDFYSERIRKGSK